MEAAAVGDECCVDPIWSATSNWVAAGGGSLGDAITFYTSAAIEDKEQEARPILLLRPEGDDPPPCEMTICFREKHEIYRVYVRSTVRIYEVNNNNGTAEIPDKVVRSHSNNSDEDGWVQVKAPDSLLQHDKEYSMSEKCDDGIDSPKLQIH